MSRGSQSVSDRAFARLLSILPRAFRARFDRDMQDLFRDQLGAARARGGRAVVRLWFAVAGGLLRVGLGERAEAIRRSLSQFAESAHDARSPDMLEHVRNDIGFALRMLRKSPVFTVVAVSAIALGSGAVTTIFSAMNAVVLRPLPGAAEASRLVGIELAERDGRFEVAGTSAIYEGLRDDARTMNGVAAWGRVSLTISAGGEGAVVSGNYASGNYFSVLGVRPALGRFFLPEEDRTPNSHPVLVVSHAFWTTRLGADSGAIGRAVRVNGNPYTLIGVAPEGFRGVITLIPVDGWVPLMMQGQINPHRNLAVARWLRMFGRLQDGVAMDVAQADLGVIAAAQAAQPSAGASARTRQVTGVRLAMLRAVPEDARGVFFGFMSLLLGAATLVLLIASVNVAAMLSARAMARRREIAMRAALGASRGRLVAQLLTEVLLLFCIGGSGGVALAFAATRAATTVTLPTDVVVPPDMAPDWRVMAFALLVSLVTGLVFGLAPALGASRDDIVTRLRADSVGAGTRRGWAGNTLIVAQLALSLVLLVAAGLFTRALDIGSRVDPGFERAGVSIASFNTETWGYDSTKARQFYRDVRADIAAVPGVTSVTFASFAPLVTRSMNDSIALASGENVFTWMTNVGGDYFRTLRMPLVAGRALASTDDERGQRVAVVNQTLARRLAPDGNVIGHTFRRGQTPVTVVGIARDAKYAFFSEETPPMAYFSIEQFWQPHQTLLVRGEATQAQVAQSVRVAMQRVDGALPTASVMSLERASNVTVIPQLIASIVTAALGGVGLLLAALGLYGIIAYSVNRRAREMGIRAALGARRADVLRLVIGEGMRLAIAGVILGLVLAVGATRLIASFLLDVNAMDAVTVGGMSLLFIVVALLATYIPARRAAGTDPAVALRSE